jgi:hypothetical protein
MDQALKDPIDSHVTLEAYLRSSEYEPDAEYVDGRVALSEIKALLPHRRP